MRIPLTRAVDLGVAKLLPDVDRPRAWLLTVDGAPQSYVDLDDPSHLEFEYVRRLAHVLDQLPGGPLDLLHLGGGAMTLARYAARTRAGARQTVVEADAALSALVAEYLPLPSGCAVEVTVADAREAIGRTAAASVDLLVADVFSGARVPGSLTTLPWVRAAARVLRPGGVYAANLADAAPFRFLGSQLATFATEFDHLAVIAEPSVLRGRRYGNAVLLASRRELPLAGLARSTAADAFPARVVHGEALRKLMRGAEPVREDEAPARSPEPPSGAFTVG
ncbi:fused MFS/spermidine synthase [Streptomyces sp. XM4193]|uniref:spermidine synthase n=1 Tax=Streptomyces sp. XM4193 TaxID=2929782 RepID=UPI001FFBA108|nr:fused MFS/spermidine synthase [Streptomyces sp. XM4193]MCK1798957.1 fused MFS/spermidine synthase [Streptomyces sp. XM4193]